MKDFKKIANIHKVLADSTRLAILRIVKQHPGCTTQDILNNLKISASTLTFHMKKLIGINSVYTSKKGSFLCYYPNLEQFKYICDHMQKAIDIALTQFITNNKFVLFKNKDFLKVLNIFADPTRLNILILIGTHPGVTGKELHILSKESEASVSFHTKVLEKSKFINSKKISNQVYYWIDIGFLVTFHRFLNQHRLMPIGESIFEEKE